MFWFWSVVVSYICLAISLHTPISPIYVVPFLALYVAFVTDLRDRAQWVIPLVLLILSVGLQYWDRWSLLAAVDVQIALLASLVTLIAAICVGRYYRETYRATYPQFLNLLVLATVVIWGVTTTVEWSTYLPEVAAYPIYHVSRIQGLLQTLSYNLAFAMILGLIPIPNKEL